MVDPATIMTLLSLAQIAGSALKAKSQVDEGSQSAEIFEFNAQLKQQEAFLIGEKAKLDLIVEREAARRTLALASAQFAGRGVRALTGSPADVMFEIAEALEMDRLITQFNTDIDQLNSINESKLLELKADQSRTAGKTDAGSTILGALPLLGNLNFGGGGGATPTAAPVQLDTNFLTSSTTAFA